MDLKNYDEIVSLASQMVVQALLSNEKDLDNRTLTVDADVAEVMRELGMEITTKIYEKILNDHVEKDKENGLTIKKHPTIRFNTIFGPIEIGSPYMWNESGRSKPLAEKMGITHNGRTITVERALSDFGSEESFGRASKRFTEHYKYDLSPSTASRVTKAIASDAQMFVENKLAEAAEKYGENNNDAKELESLLTELDGCEIRTATSTPTETGETSPVLNLPKKEKAIRWREVRIGFSRPLNSVNKIYIGRMDTYPPVVNQLFGAAVLAGMTPNTDAIGVADGGNGLREELENQFENLLFILDKKHLRDHLYETADELKISSNDRKQWVEDFLERIAGGQVGQVIKELEKINEGCQNRRLKRLIGYLTRFMDAVNYDEFRAHGYPLGSGEVESAHKSIPQERMKIPGACWHPDSVNPMLSLRVLRANDWWDDFWKSRVADLMAA